MAAIESSRLVHVQNPPPAQDPVQQDTTPVVDPASTQSTSQPLTPEQARVDAALAQLEAAQNAKAAVENPGDYPFLQEDIDTAKANLKAAIEAELASRVQQLPAGQTPDDATIKQWGEEIAARYAQNPALQTAVRDALGTIGNPFRAPASKGDPTKDVAALSAAFAKATPDVQQRMLQDPATREILDRAAAWASEPLTKSMDDRYANQGQYLKSAADAAKRLDQITAGLPPEMQRQVINKAMPTFEKFNQEYEKKFGNRDSPWGADGTTSLLNASSRVTGTPEAEALMKVAAPWGATDPAMIKGIQQAAKSDIDAYAKEMAELNWLIKSLGPAVSPERLQQTIENYRSAKEATNPGWQQKVQDLQKSIAARGNALLALSMQQAKLDPAHRNPAVQDALAAAWNSPEGQAAGIAAMKQNPQVASGDNALALKNFFSSIKLADSARKLTGEIVNTYVMSKVADAVGKVNINDPASLARAREALEGLKSSGMGSLVGVTPDEFNKGIDALKSAMPAEGDTPDKLKAKQAQLDSDLKGIKGFATNTHQGQLFRSLGVLGAAFSTANAANRAITDPSLANTVAALSTAASLDKSVADALKVFGKAPEGSDAAFLTGRRASAVIGAFGAVGDAALAVDALVRKNDPVAAAMFGTAAAGGALATAGAYVSSAWMGPVGVALVIGGTIGSMVWENAKNANKYEGGESAEARAVFFREAGFDDEAIKVLVNNSGDGHNVVPFLLEYGKAHGLSPEETVKWVNELSSKDLALLRDVFHRTADKLDGKAGKFGATASNDAEVVNGMDNTSLWAGEPMISATQMDAVLEQFGIKLPGTTAGTGGGGGGGGGGGVKFT